MYAMPSPISVSNLVVTCNIGQSIDPYLVCHALGGNVGPNFPSTFVKLKNPEMTLSIFQSGNIIAIGCPSVEAAIEALYTTIEKLSDAFNTPFFLYDFKIVLLVCSTKLSYKLNIYLLHNYFGVCSQWTPENFPGVKIELPYKKWTLIAFDSGTLILTGFGSYEEIPLAVKMINSDLKLKRFALGNEQFSREEIEESHRFNQQRNAMKRKSHGNKYKIHRTTADRTSSSVTSSSLLPMTTTTATTKSTTSVKDSKSHTRFRKEDNSIYYALHSSTKLRKLNHRHKPY